MSSKKRLALAAVLAITIIAIASNPASAADTIEFMTDWWRSRL